MAKQRRVRYRTTKTAVLQRAQEHQHRQRRRGMISATEDPSGELVTLHADVGGKAESRVLEVRDQDIESGTVPVDRQIKAFVRRLPTTKERSKKARK